MLKNRQILSFHVEFKKKRWGTKINFKITIEFVFNLEDQQ